MISEYVPWEDSYGMHCSGKIIFNSGIVSDTTWGLSEVVGSCVACTSSAASSWVFSVDEGSCGLDALRHYSAWALSEANGSCGVWTVRAATPLWGVGSCVLSPNPIYCISVWVGMARVERL